MTKHAIGIVVLLAGCTGEQQPVASSLPTVPQAVKSPFEYRIIEKDETPHFMGPQVVLMIETTNDAAKKATEDDLRQFWEHISPSFGDRRVFLRLRTPVPGVTPWGVITRLNLTGQWEVNVKRNEFGIDAEPYHFVDKIDRSKPNQQAMILTLPVANQIIERLKRSGWTVTYRSENLVKADLPAAGMESFSVTLTPEGIDLDAWDKDDSAIFDVIELLTEEFGIGKEIKRKMQSVIGTPEYFRGTRNGVAVWHWTIRDYDVSYFHTEPGIDDVSIGYAN